MSIKQIIIRMLPQRMIIILRKALLSTEHSILIEPEKSLNIVSTVKEANFEDSFYPECFEHCKEQHLEVFIPAEYMFLEPNASVNLNSDVVITEKGVYWEKFNIEEFLTWARPSDCNVVWFDKTHIFIKKAKRNEYIAGKTLSLVGVWSNHWGHCMYQYLPKLYSAGEAGVLNQPINVLVAYNEDKTILEIINHYLHNFPQARLVFAQPDTDYVCEELYFMPCPGSSFNNPNFRLDYPYYISRHVLDKTKKYIIDPIIEKIKQNPTKHEKLFLGRPGLRRTLSNYEEVHDYFKSMGYIDVDGASLTLEEKADLFYHAKEVCGMYGSAFLNLMFCNHAKSLCFLNYRMSTDTSLYLQIRDYVSVLVNVTGSDEDDTYHSNFYIPLDKVKRAYRQYIQN